jgi:hypothetical protein
MNCRVGHLPSNLVVLPGPDTALVSVSYRTVPCQLPLQFLANVPDRPNPGPPYFHDFFDLKQLLCCFFDDIFMVPKCQEALFSPGYAVKKSFGTVSNPRLSTRPLTRGPHLLVQNCTAGGLDRGGYTPSTPPHPGVWLDI